MPEKNLFVEEPVAQWFGDMMKRLLRNTAVTAQKQNYFCLASRSQAIPPPVFDCLQYAVIV